MKVYVIEKGAWSYVDIIGVVTKKEVAEEYQKKILDTRYTEFELDTLYEIPKDKKLYEYRIIKYKNEDYKIEEDDDEFRIENYEYRYHIHIFARNDIEAIREVNEKLAILNTIGLEPDSNALYDKIKELFPFHI